MPQWVQNEHMAFVVCNIDGVQVGEYDELWAAKAACHDLALEAAANGDTTNGYYIHDSADFDGYLAKDFAS